MPKKKQAMSHEAAKELCDAVAAAMLEKKAQGVTSLDLSSIDGAICTYFVLCHADSTTQVDAIANHIEEYVRTALGQKPRRVEGAENALWILVDYVDVIAHVFQAETRDFYRIEQLWADAAQQEYTDEPVAVAKKSAVAKKKTAAKSATAKSATTKSATAKKLKEK